MRGSLFAGLFVVATAAWAAEKPILAPAGEMRASLAVKVDQNQIAGVPIIFELTIKNTSTKALAYWCGGPDHYPDAAGFEVVIVDQAGKERRFSMSNGQNHGGSGRGNEIGPGDSSKLPAAIEGLPAGKYTIKMIATGAEGSFPNSYPAMEWKSGQALEVKEDAAAAKKFANDLLKQVREGTPFSEHVAANYKIQLVIDAMIHDLESSDSAVSAQAAHFIYKLDELPEGLGAVIRKAMMTQLSAESNLARAELGQLAESEGSDDALEAVLAYVAAYPENEGALQNLFQFKQEKAAKKLREFVKSGHSYIGIRAAVGLSLRRDPAAIRLLIEVAREKGNAVRDWALAPLSEYWDDESAMAALREAVTDADENVRRSAQSALTYAEQQRERAHAGAGKK